MKQEDFMELIGAVHKTSDGYDTSRWEQYKQECIESGHKLEVPPPCVLALDFDTAAAYNEFAQERLPFFRQFVAVQYNIRDIKFLLTESKSGGKHVRLFHHGFEYFELNERLLFHSVLGSDFKREMISFWRAYTNKSAEVPNLLRETAEGARHVELFYLARRHRPPHWLDLYQ